jgi:hypothetical protein
MPVSRRKFLQHGAFAAAAIAAAPLPAWSSGHQPPPNPESQHAAPPLGHASGTISFFGRKAFEQAVGSAFEVSLGANSQPVYLTLVAVDDSPALSPVDPRSMAVPPPPSTLVITTGFVLSFQSSAQPLAQGTYAFQHPTLGKFQLFIVPGSQGSQSYTAVFNQLTGGPAPTPPRLRPPAGTRPEGVIGAGGIGSGNAAGSSSGGAANSGGSSAGRPAQETLEPVVGRQLETKLPE